MINKWLSKQNREQGFTLFVAIVVTATLLLVAAGIVNLAYKHSIIARAGQDSQLAFYAADTGIECAFYWDLKDSSSVFLASTPATSFDCGGQTVQNLSKTVSGGTATTTFLIGDPYCAEVSVIKGSTETRVESRGYNTCDPNNVRRVERAVRAIY
jgi:Tfp pilus assembly protein PilX